MDILFKPKNSGKKGNHVFRCHQNDVANFCAGDLLHNFMVETAAKSNGGWGAVTDNEEPVKEEDILLEIFKHCTPSTMFMLADVQGGDADRYLFPHLPIDKPRVVESTFGGNVNAIVQITASLSDYYRNRNSGNMVRHATIVTELLDSLPAKAKTTKKRLFG